jgi:hypothetical protein
MMSKDEFERSQREARERHRRLGSLMEEQLLKAWSMPTLDDHPKRSISSPILIWLLVANTVLLALIAGVLVIGKLIS